MAFHDTFRGTGLNEAGEVSVTRLDKSELIRVQRWTFGRVLVAVFEAKTAVVPTVHGKARLQQGCDFFGCTVPTFHHHNAGHLNHLVHVRYFAGNCKTRLVVFYRQGPSSSVASSVSRIYCMLIGPFVTSGCYNGD